MSEYIGMCAHTDVRRHALRVMYQAVKTVVGHSLEMSLHQDWILKSNEKCAPSDSASEPWLRSFKKEKPQHLGFPRGPPPWY